MSTIIKRISFFLVVSFALPLWSGCDEPPAPPPKAKVIREKIAALPPDFLQGSASDSADTDREGGGRIALNTAVISSLDQESSRPVESGASKSDAAQNAAQPSQISQQEIPNPSDGSVAVVSDFTNPTDEEVETDDLVASISEIARVEAAEGYVAYAPDERVDPFVPLFKEEPETQEPEEKKTDGQPKPPPRPPTPLEKLDLSQLKLVGIVRTPRGNKAMVEEASGKGYIIDKGTYIGIHSGQVVDIKKDRIVVEEKDTDPMGKVTVRTREIKFQRPSGDEYYEM